MVLSPDPKIERLAPSLLLLITKLFVMWQSENIVIVFVEFSQIRLD
jgi:hypothetical protein